MSTSVRRIDLSNLKFLKRDVSHRMDVNHVKRMDNSKMELFETLGYKTIDNQKLPDSLRGIK